MRLGRFGFVHFRFAFCCALVLSERWPVTCFAVVLLHYTEEAATPRLGRFGLVPHVRFALWFAPVFL